MKEQEIKNGIVAASVIDPMVKAFFSVVDGVYFFGFEDRVSGRLFGVDRYRDAQRCMKEFFETVFLFRGTEGGKDR